MSFNSELEAFRAYVKTFPNNSTLLIDTYDVLQGAENAATVAKELEAKGKKLGAVRLDSGDIAKDSKKIRELLDSKGLDYIRIVASNDLNEYKIEEFRKQEAKINGYGVGTELITSKPIAAIPGVYKLVEDNAGAKIKLSAEKKTYPGEKQLFRVEEDGNYPYDILAMESEKIKGKPLLERVIKNGQRVVKRRKLDEIRKYCLEEVAKLPEQTKKLIAEPYETRTSQQLDNLVENLTAKYGRI
jgi:nicotinate phosphoribosyltransferase